MKTVEELGQYKHIFIINENSGTEASKREARNAIYYNAIKLKINMNLKFCFEKERATEYIEKEFSNKQPTIFYSVGGDGTLNHMVNTIMRLKKEEDKPMIQVLSSGTANDFLRTVYQNRNILLDEMLLSNNWVDVDLIKIESDLQTHYAMNGLSIGLDARALEIADYLRNSSGKNNTYKKAIFKVIKENTPSNLDIKIENSTKWMPHTQTLVSISNGQYYGDGRRIAPHASLTDGKLDVVAVEHVNRLKLLGLLMSLEKGGKHITKDKVFMDQSSSITINNDETIKYQADGELAEAKTIHATCLKKSIRLKY